MIALRTTGIVSEIINAKIGRPYFAIFYTSPDSSVPYWLLSDGGASTGDEEGFVGGGCVGSKQ